MRMSRLLIVVIAVWSLACNQVNPLAPADHALVDWTGTAYGCSPRRPTPIFTGVEIRTGSHQTGNRLEIEITRPEDRIYATFHRQDGRWVLCDWDTTDN